MKKFDLIVHVQSEKQIPQLAPQNRVRAVDLPAASIKAIHADAAMKQAKRLLEGAGYSVRSVAMGPSGIVVVVFNAKATKEAKSLIANRAKNQLLASKK
jgi:hypothetical protein